MIVEKIHQQGPSGRIHLVSTYKGDPIRLTDCGQATDRYPLDYWETTEKPITCGRCIIIQEQRRIRAERLKR